MYVVPFNYVLHEINKCAWIITYIAFMYYRFIYIYIYISYLLAVFSFISLKKKKIGLFISLKFELCTKHMRLLQTI